MKKVIHIVVAIVLLAFCNNLIAQNGWQQFRKSDYSMANKYDDTWWFFDMDRILEDHEGNIWFGSNRYNGSRWEAMGPIDKKSYVFDMLCDSNGDIWISVLAKGVYRFSQGKWTLYSTEFGVRPWGQTLFEDSKGTIWIGACNGIYSFKDEKLQKSANCGRLVTGITEDIEGNIWACTSSGVYKCNGTGWQNHTTNEIIGSRSVVVDAYFDKQGNLWVATLMGISKYKPLS